MLTLWHIIKILVFLLYPTIICAFLGAVQENFMELVLLSALWQFGRIIWWGCIPHKNQDYTERPDVKEGENGADIDDVINEYGEIEESERRN